MEYWYHGNTPTRHPKLGLIQPGRNRFSETQQAQVDGLVALGILVPVEGGVEVPPAPVRQQTHESVRARVPERFTRIVVRPM